MLPSERTLVRPSDRQWVLRLVLWLEWTLAQPSELMLVWKRVRQSDQKSEQRWVLLLVLQWDRQWGQRSVLPSERTLVLL